MNKERLEMLAAHLEMLPSEEFDMDKWCGTACCIAGHVFKLASLKPTSFTAFKAAQWLGSDYSTLRPLFIPNPEMAPSPYFATPQQAASVVRHLNDTGVVAWEKFLS